MMIQGSQLRHAESCPSRGTWIEMPSLSFDCLWFASCPSRGTWIEMNNHESQSNHETSRAPRGARGLKLEAALSPDDSCWCRAPRGARGLKFAPVIDNLYLDSRAPRGARGLKCFRNDAEVYVTLSCPSRGMWIEMC